jgi:hypothetical protein
MCDNVKTYRIDIKNAEGYRKIVQDYRSKIHGLMESDELKTIRTYMSTYVAKIIIYFYSMLPNAGKGVFIKACQVMADELTRPSDGGKALNVGMYEIILIQMYYDASARCTSVVTRDKQNQIMHGRTMDWEMGSNESSLHELTIKVEGYDGDRLLFRGISWAGMVGLFTGTNVPHQFSVSINYRPDVRNTKVRLQEALEHLWIPKNTIEKVREYFNEMQQEILIGLFRVVDQTNVPCAVLVYNLVSQKQQGWFGQYEITFDTATEILKSQKLLSSVYFTIAGVNNAHIIARNVYDVAGIQSLNDLPYIMVANKDWWNNRSIDIMNSKRRAKIVKEEIKNRTQISERDLERLMKKVVNSITIYGVIMRPSNNGSIRFFHCKE